MSKESNEVPKKAVPVSYNARSRAYKGHAKTVKFPTPESRLKCHEEFIEHIKAGYSKKSFPPCSYNTLQKYLKEFPEDFNAEEIDEAFRTGRKFWENIGMDQARGINGGNGTTWFRIMQNQYDYRDRLDVTSKENEINQSVIDMSKLDDDSLEKLADIMASARVDDGEDE